MDTLGTLDEQAVGSELELGLDSPEQEPDPQEQDQEFLERLEGPIKSLLETYVFTPNRQSRIIQVNRNWRNLLYFRGDQYLVPITLPGGAIEYRQASPENIRQAMGLGEQDPMPEIFDYVFNFIQPDINKQVALVSRLKYGQAATLLLPVNAAVKAEAAPSLYIADDVSDMLDQILSLPDKIETVIRYLDLYGAVFIHTPYVIDAAKYGVEIIPQTKIIETPVPASWNCTDCGSSQPEEMGPVCAKCSYLMTADDYQPATSIPQAVPDEPLKIPRGMPELEVYNTSTTYIQFDAMSCDHSPWLIWEGYGRLGKLRQEYRDVPRIFNLLKDSFPSVSGFGSFADYGRSIQSAMSSMLGTPSGINRIGQVPTLKAWLDPEMYELLEDKDDDLRLELIKRFPEGIKLEFVSDSLAKVMPENKNTVWTCLAPTKTSPLMAEKPIFDIYFEGQDIVNDALGLSEQIMSSSIPVFLYDPSLVDEEKVNDLARRVNQWVQTKKGTQGSIKDRVYQLTPSQPTQVPMEIAQFVIQFCRENSGVTEAAFGAASSDTATESENNLQQALQMFGPIYATIRRAVSELKYKATSLIAKFNNDEIPFPIEGRPPVIVPCEGLSNLTTLPWAYTSDEQHPSTPASRRRAVMEILRDPNLAMNFPELRDPSNFEAIQEATGLHLNNPAMVQKEAIEALVPEIIAGTAQIPLPPSVYPPELVTQVLSYWLLDRQGTKLKQTDPEGWSQVVQFIDANQQALAPPPMEGDPNDPNAPPDAGGGGDPNTPPDDGSGLGDQAPIPEGDPEQLTGGPPPAGFA